MARRGNIKTGPASRRRKRRREGTTIAQRDVLASHVLRSLASERRRAVASWRILILLRRIASQSNPPQPIPSPDRAATVVRRLLERGDLDHVQEVKNVYVVTAPYAAAIPLSDEQILQEANPRCFFSHLTALVHHGLTDIIPSRIYASTPLPQSKRPILGTSPEDWFELPLPKGQVPRMIRQVPIVWSRPRSEDGITVAYSQGASIYITDIEKTLLDVLAAPTRAQGIANVLRAWHQASESWDLGRLLDYVPSHSPIMRQRVGYLVERLGLSHPTLEAWKQDLKRGGSMRLVSGVPYSSTFSERWNLSLNVPDSVLSLLDG